MRHNPLDLIIPMVDDLIVMDVMDGPVITVTRAHARNGLYRGIHHIHHSGAEVMPNR